MKQRLCILLAFGALFLSPLMCGGGEIVVQYPVGMTCPAGSVFSSTDDGHPVCRAK